MNRDEYERCFHEALSKAFAARALNVREAYFDLATFYHEKLGGHVRGVPSNDDLHRCLTKRARAS